MKTKKIFFVIPIILFLVGCDDLSTVEYNSTKTPEEILVAVTYGTDKKFEFDFNYESDEVLSDGKVIFKMEFATDEFLSKYDSYIEFIDNEMGCKFAILPDITLREFQWIEIGNTTTEGVLGVQYYKRSVLYSAGDLLSNIPFVVKAMDDDMPIRGISFLDANDERCYFAIALNQAEPSERPGKFIIIEF